MIEVKTDLPGPPTELTAFFARATNGLLVKGRLAA